MVDGVDRFRRRLRSIPDKVRAEVVKQLEIEAEKVCDLMRVLVPVRSGRGRESIGWTWGDAPKGTISVGKVAGREYDSLSITIYAGGGDAWYLKFQEFGTRKMAANPFFYPAWRSERRRVRASITRAVKRGFKKV